MKKKSSDTGDVSHPSCLYLFPVKTTLFKFTVSIIPMHDGVKNLVLKKIHFRLSLNNDHGSWEEVLPACGKQGGDGGLALSD